MTLFKINSSDNQNFLEGKFYHIYSAYIKD